MSENDTPPKEWNPKFRKRKRWQGASFTPVNAAAELGDGAWCPKCKTRHGYKYALDIMYERKKNGKWFILWSCKKYGTVVQEMELPSGQA